MGELEQQPIVLQGPKRYACSPRLDHRHPDAAHSIGLMAAHWPENAAGEGVTATAAGAGVLAAMATFAWTRGWRS
jgi:hypothetical protein